MPSDLSFMKFLPSEDFTGVDAVKRIYSTDAKCCRMTHLVCLGQAPEMIIFAAQQSALLHRKNCR